MLILNKIVPELKIRFSSVYSLYFDEIQKEIFIFYLGEKNEELAKEIRGFFKERVSPLILVNIACSKKQLGVEEVLAIATITRKGGSDAF